MSGFKPKAYFRGAPGSAQAPQVDFQPFGNQPSTNTATSGTR